MITITKFETQDCVGEPLVETAADRLDTTLCDKDNFFKCGASGGDAYPKPRYLGKIALGSDDGTCVMDDCMLFTDETCSVLKLFLAFRHSS